MTTETLDALAPYEPIRAAIAKLKKENAATVFDYESAKGNKLARSHVAGLRTHKADIERKRKELKQDALDYGRKVDAVAKELTAEVEQMIEVHQKPLEEIEAREAARLASISMPLDPIADAFTCEQIIARVEAVKIDDSWPSNAAKKREETLACLRARLDELVKQECEAAELAKLRAEKEAREAADRKAAEEKQRAEREARIAKEAADRAVAAERERALAAEAKAAREAAELKAAEEKRAANKKHREKILKEVAEALSKMVWGDAESDSYHMANRAHLTEHLAQAIADGKIPHTSIKF